MKISPIIPILKANNTKKLSAKNNTSINYTSQDFKEIPLQFFQIGFSAKEKIHTDFQKRLTYLKDTLGISAAYAKKIAAYDDERYKKALTLLDTDIEEEVVEEASKLNNNHFKRALSLLKMNVTNQSLVEIAGFEDETYKKAVKFLKEDFVPDSVTDLACYSEEQVKRVYEYINKGLPSEVATKLASVNEKDADFVLGLLDNEVSLDTAMEIVEYPEEKREKIIHNIESGVEEESVISISNLPEKAAERVKELQAMNIGDDIVADCAELNDDDYKYILDSMRAGTYPEHAYDVMVMKQKNKINPIYEECREKGYGVNAAYTISTLQEGERDVLEKMIAKFPQLEDYFKNNFDVDMAILQNTQEDKAHLLLTKQYVVPGSAKVALTVIFDSNGNETKSRVEEYSNFATTGTVKGSGNVVQSAYQKGGDIKRMLHYVSDEETGNLKGVYFSTITDDLKGCFETTYYDINDFKTDSTSLLGEVNVDVTDCVKSRGTPLSKVTKNSDGSISFNETFTWNGFKTEREYSEKKDESGNFIYRTYSYNIYDKDGNAISEIERSWTKNEDGTVTNIINGNEYNLKFDDKNKIIYIRSNGKIKSIKFDKKLAKCSKENLWAIIKKTDIDTLLTIYNDVRKWYHCQSTNDYADGYSKILATGGSIPIITHETGHLKSYERNDAMLEDKKIKEVYNKEMESFQKNFSYNEQEFIEYFSPRADLCESDGLSEFIAETNMIATTYGAGETSLNTRNQILVRFFPETIATIAKKLGKTSKKNLICKE